MPDPIDEEKYSRYFAVAKVSDLLTDLPKDTNPREQNLQTSVAKKNQNGVGGARFGAVISSA
jgi:hypothetical protein